MKIAELREKIDQRFSHLKNELTLIRTGRATTALVENIKVDAYEGASALTIKELATISLPDAATITVHPWDLHLLPKIEEAIRKSPGGLSPVVFDDLIRINLPPLSAERRQEFVKVVKTKVEECKVEIRQIRQDEMKAIDEMEQNGVLSEDERFRQREEVEKIVKEKTHEVEALGLSKEAELLKV